MGDPAGFDENARPTFTATYQLADDDSANGKLLVNVEIPDGWTVYSLEQPSPLIPLSFAVKQPDGASITGKGQPSAAPKRVEQDGMVQEKHTGTVSWEFPIKVAGDLSKPPEIVLSVKGQTCSDVGSCVMIKEEVTATFVGKVESWRGNCKASDVSERLLPNRRCRK